MNCVDNCTLVPLEIRKDHLGQRFFHRLDNQKNLPLDAAKQILCEPWNLEKGANYYSRNSTTFSYLGRLPEGANAVVFGAPLRIDEKEFRPVNFYEIKIKDL